MIEFQHQRIAAFDAIHDMRGNPPGIRKNTKGATGIGQGKLHRFAGIVRHRERQHVGTAQGK